jgi:hypothetical protein
MNAHNVNSLIGLNINFQNIHYVGDSLIGELEIDRSLEAWVELMRGFSP